MVSSGESGKIEKRMVVEYGISLDGVRLPLAMLRRLRAQGRWDAPFTEATAEQEQVLLMHALAERHNQAGLHRGTGLTGFLDAIPYEPTVCSRSFPTRGRAPGASPSRCRPAAPRPEAFVHDQDFVPPSAAAVSYRHDFDALRAASTRVVMGAGRNSAR